MNEEHKLKQNHGSDGLDTPNGPNEPTGPNGSDVPGFYGIHYSLNNDLVPTDYETTRLDSVFFSEISCCTVALGVAGLIVA